MRNIAEIIEDDKNGKQLSQTERQISVAYIQGKYDAVRELKIGKASNTNEVLDKIRVEILERCFDVPYKNQAFDYGLKIVKWSDVREILDKYKAF